MCKGKATDEVERVTVGQRSLPEQLLLLRGGAKFQFGGDNLLHTLVHPEQAPSWLPVLPFACAARSGESVPCRATAMQEVR
jgi:hypothetical protein